MIPVRRSTFSGTVTAFAMAAVSAWGQDAAPTPTATVPAVSATTPDAPATTAGSPLPLPAPPGAPAAGEPKVETIVFVRHGEKPDDDEGQLSPQGLNRALALPKVLVGKFGRGDFIFAPATTKKPASHHHGAFSYVRPLMTIEPTAISLGLPVETKFAFDEIAGLQSELCTPAYQRATVFVAWEHHLLDELVKHLVVAFGGDVQDVPAWPDEDFDSIFVVRLRTDAQGRRSVTFEHDLERLNGQSTAQPGPASP